jgi:hypothetical protein
LLRRLVDSAGGYERLPTSLWDPVLLLIVVTGDQQRAIEFVNTRLSDRNGFDPTRALMLTLFTYTHYAWRGEQDEIVDDWKIQLDEARRHPSEVVRAEAHWGAATLAQIAGDHELMLTEGRELLDMRVVGSTHWISSLALVAWAEREVGHLDSAIRMSDETFDMGYRYADRTGVYMGLALHAIALQSLGEAEAAATVAAIFPPEPSGSFRDEDGWAYPSGSTFAMARPLVELDHWLDTQVGLERRQELEARGRTMSPRELQAVAHEAEARHLDLAPVSSEFSDAG